MKPSHYYHDIDIRVIWRCQICLMNPKYYEIIEKIRFFCITLRLKIQRNCEDFYQKCKKYGLFLSKSNASAVLCSFNNRKFNVCFVQGIYVHKLTKTLFRNSNYSQTPRFAPLLAIAVFGPCLGPFPGILLRFKKWYFE